VKDKVNHRGTEAQRRGEKKRREEKGTLIATDQR
jgi:hypothetical protein